MQLINTRPKARQSERNQRIYNFLTTHQVGVLATVTPNGDPHAVVIYFAVDENFDITFVTKNETKKHDNLQHNHRAVLVSFDPTWQTTAQVTGFTDRVYDEAALHRIIRSNSVAALQTSDAGIPPLSKLKAGDYVAYKLQPVQIRMAVFARPDPGGYEMFETVDL